MSPSSPRTAYPTLARLFAAYVNQDFDVHGPDPLDAVRAFVRDVTPATRARAADEAARLLRRARTETGLDRTLGALRCGVWPKARGTTARGFLEAVAAVLRAPA